MKRIMTYTNSENQTITLNQYPYFSSLSNLRDWKYEVTENDGLAVAFVRGMNERTLSVTIVNDSLTARANLFDAFETDIANMTAGTLKIGDWSLNCYVVESEKTNGGELDRSFKFKIYSENPAWRKTTTYLFDGRDSGGRSGINNGRDYPRCYDWDYSEPNANSKQILIENPGGAGFILRVYGAATSPEIYINNNKYKVNANIGTTQQLLLTAVGNDKSIYTVSESGAKTNVFASRDKAFSVFTPLRNGSNTVAFGALKFDLSVIEERSEPKWN